MRPPISPSARASSFLHGLPLRTRILTRRGWLTQDEVRVGDETIGYSLATGRSQWTRITAIHHAGVMDIWRFGDGFWSAECTPEHRWLADKMNHDYTEVAVEPRLVRLNEKRVRHRVILAREADTGDGLPISMNEVALLGWIAGDGWERKAYARYGSTRGGGTPGTFHVSQTKQRNWPRIEQALSDGKSSIVRTRNGHREWRLSAPYAKDLIERAGHPKADPLSQVLAMSCKQRAAWLEAIIAAEGHQGRNYTQISQCKGPLADAIVLAVYLSGHTASIYEHDRREESARHKQVSLTIGITRGRLGTSDHPGAFKKPAGSAEVWCVTTDLGSWTAEQDGHVFLTGNSVGGSYRSVTRGKAGDSGPAWRARRESVQSL